MSLIIVDSYSESNYDSWFYYRSGTEKGSHSFTGKAGNLVSCKWFLRKWGSPTGNIVAKLYAHSGVFGISSIPTGEPLAVSNTIDIATISIYWSLIIFDFVGANQFIFIDGVKYCISIEFSGGDASNYLKVGADMTSPTHPGNIADYYEGNWVLYPDRDFIFYVYAEETRDPFVTLSVEKRIKSLTVQELQTDLSIEKRLIDLDIQKK